MSVARLPVAVVIQFVLEHEQSVLDPECHLDQDQPQPPKHAFHNIREPECRYVRPVRSEGSPGVGVQRADRAGVYENNPTRRTQSDPIRPNTRSARAPVSKGLRVSSPTPTPTGGYDG
jgi:hypothetical protein